MLVKAIVVSIVFGLHCPILTADAAQIWLAGVDPVVQSTIDKRTVPDYLDLFEPIAPWNKAAEAVQVFKTSTQFLAKASDATLSHMFADLKRRNIALGMEALMLTTTAKCGTGIEGMVGFRR